MLQSLITSKTRIRLLLKFFLNSQTTGYLRSLESEFGESTNSIRVELNRLEKAGLLGSASKGNKKIYFANTNHPLFNDINNILKKFVGIDQLVEQVISKIDDLQFAYLTGDFAKGTNSPVIDLALVGNNLDQISIDQLILNAEQQIGRAINHVVLTETDLHQLFENKPLLLIWSKNQVGS